MKNQRSECRLLAIDSAQPRQHHPSAGRPNPAQDRLLTTRHQLLTTWKEIAAVLGVSVRTAQLWTFNRGLPIIRYGGRVAISRQAIEKWFLSPMSGQRPVADRRVRNTPADPPSQALPNPGPQVTPGGGASPQNWAILVVDDEESIREAIALALEAEGHHVIRGADGLDAMERLRQFGGTVRLVITDIDMPRMSGLALCNVLRRERPGIPIIAMSGHGLPDQDASGVRFLLKPFRFGTLLNLVEEVLGLDFPG